MKSLGCTVFDPETGDRKYDPQRNPLLIPGVTATTYLFGFAIRQKQDNSRHAPLGAAQWFCDVLNARFGGGYSIAEPLTGIGPMGRAFGLCVWSQPMQMIARPDGSTFEAGRISTVLGDEVNNANERMRDWEICNLAGVPYGAGVSEAILAPLAVA